MEGEGSSSSSKNKKAVRRPMNAFLIFCKRHRSKVREKHPQMDNRSITRVLGDIWAKMDKQEKASFTLLAKQYKDAFMKANPGYKWHSSDKVHSGNATSKHGNDGGASASLVNTSTTYAGKSSTSASSHKPQHLQDIRVSTEITPGKLADPGQMGGLNLLLTAGKDSKTRPIPASHKSSPAPSSYSSSYPFSFTPISPQPPTKPHMGQASSILSSSTLPSSSSSSSLSSSSLFSPLLSSPHSTTTASPMKSQKSRCPNAPSSSLLSSPSSSSLLESVTSNSALLQLAEMCTTELYNGTEEPSDRPQQCLSPFAVAPPKKRARQWQNQSLSPLADDNGRKHQQGLSSVSPNNSRYVNTVVSLKDRQQAVTGRHELPLDLSQIDGVPKKKKLSRKQTRGGGREGVRGGVKESLEARKRKRSSSATDSVSSSSSPSVSPVIMEGKLTSRSDRRQNVSAVSVRDDVSLSSCKFLSPSNPGAANEDSIQLSVSPSRDRVDTALYERSKIASLLQAAPTLAPTSPSSSSSLSTNCLSVSPAPSNRCSDNSCCLNDFTKVQPLNRDVHSRPPAASVASSMMSSYSQSQQPLQQQPFTQGKVKKKWTQRMMVEARQEEELAMAKKEFTQISSKSPISNHGAASLDDQNHQQSPVKPRSNIGDVDRISAKMEDKPIRYPWGEMNPSKQPLPPPPPINTSFPLPISGQAHKSHTLYKALTSEISPPRQRSAMVPGPRLHRPSPIKPPFPPTSVSSLSSSSSSRPETKNGHHNTFDPITACGKKFTDHIVEQLVLHGSSNDNKDTVVFPPSLPSSSSSTTTTTSQPSDFSLASSRNFRGIESSSVNDSNFCNRNSSVSGEIESNCGIWSNVASHVPMGGKQYLGSKSGELKVRDVASFPASSLVEKVARRVGSSPQTNGSPREPDGPPIKTERGPGGTTPPQQHPSSPSSSTVSTEVITIADVSPDVRHQQVNSVAGELLPPAYDVHYVCEDVSLQPVRKSRRANRGQKYQALIKEGIIQPSKERLAIRNMPRSGRSLSKEDGSESQQHPDVMRTNSWKERGTPSPKTVRSRASPVEMFDFDKDKVLMPLSSMAQPPQVPSSVGKKKKNKRMGGRAAAVVPTSTRSGKAGAKQGTTKTGKLGTEMYVQVHRHGVLTFDINNPLSGATLKLKYNMRGMCHTRVPYTREEMARLNGPVTGSKRRRMRNHRIIHVIHEANDEDGGFCWTEDKLKNNVDKPINPCANVEPDAPSSSVSALPASPTGIATVDRKTSDSIPSPSKTIGVLSPTTGDTRLSLNDKGLSDGISDRLSVEYSSHQGIGALKHNTSPGRISLDSKDETGSKEVMLSPLHLLTTAAIQSEQALYPSGPKFSLVESGQMSVGENLSSSSPPPINASNQISPQPASVPFSEDVGLHCGQDGRHPRQFPLSVSPGSNGPHLLKLKKCSPYSTSLRSCDKSPRTVLSSTSTGCPVVVTESPSKHLATSALLSLSLSAADFVSSTPHIMSTSPSPAPNFHGRPPASSSSLSLPSINSQEATTTATKPSPLSIPTFTPWHLNRNDSTLNSSSPRPGLSPASEVNDSSHKQSFMHHSQKLVRLLTTNTDDSIPFGKSSNPNINQSHPQTNSRASNIGKNGNLNNNRQTESVPVMHLSTVQDSVISSGVVNNVEFPRQAAKSQIPSKNRRGVDRNEGKVVKQRKRKRSSLTQMLTLQDNDKTPASTPPAPVNIVKVAAGSRLFPSPINSSVVPVSIGCTTTAPLIISNSLISDASSSSNANCVKKHKPTIWDHLSSQCPVPLKSAKTSKPPTGAPLALATTLALNQSPMPTTLNSSPTISITPNSVNNSSSRSTDNNQSQPAAMSNSLPSTMFRNCLETVQPAPRFSKYQDGGNFHEGSDTDSANEEEDDDNDKALFIAEADQPASDTDSAEEKDLQCHRTTTNTSDSISFHVKPSVLATTAYVNLNVASSSPFVHHSVPSSSPIPLNKAPSKPLSVPPTPITSFSPTVGRSKPFSESSGIAAQITLNQTPSNFHVTNIQDCRKVLINKPSSSIPDSRSCLSQSTTANVLSESTSRVVMATHPLSLAPAALPSTFVSVSSITLPSELPLSLSTKLPAVELHSPFSKPTSSPSPSSSSSSSIQSVLPTTKNLEESVRNVIVATTGSVTSGQVTVKTIAPISPYPNPHIEDLSSTCTLSSPPSSTPAASLSGYSNLAMPPTTSSPRNFTNNLISTLYLTPHLQQQPPSSSVSTLPPLPPPPSSSSSSSSPYANPPMAAIPSSAFPPTTINSTGTSVASATSHC